MYPSGTERSEYHPGSYTCGKAREVKYIEAPPRRRPRNASSPSKVKIIHFNKVTWTPTQVNFTTQRNEDDLNPTQTQFSHPNYYPFSRSPFSMPPHGFTAMLNTSPASPFMMRPPNQPMTPHSPHPLPPLNGVNPNSPMLAQPSFGTPQTSHNLIIPNTSTPSSISILQKPLESFQEEVHCQEDVSQGTQVSSKKPKTTKKKVVIDLGDDMTTTSKGRPNGRIFGLIS
ncbi:hypothetical protein L7F22_006879 [Adiantum nelumboides]|nr:hypothetical protein [Adiantum nelumboides]